MEAEVRVVGVAARRRRHEWENADETGAFSGLWKGKYEGCR